VAETVESDVVEAGGEDGGPEHAVAESAEEWAAAR
jgi:hypothetical protein